MEVKWTKHKRRHYLELLLSLLYDEYLLQTGCENLAEKKLILCLAEFKLNACFITVQ